MFNKCENCQTELEYTPEELAVFRRHSVPESKLCADCAHQRRLSFRNEWNLYKRDCDLCKKSIVTLYRPGTDLVVYCPDCFWGDRWNPLDFGQEIDFERPFFEQFAELSRKVPLLSSTVINSSNSEYNSFCVDSRNVYRSARIGDSEDVFYSYLVLHTERAMDCYNVSGSQDMYECLDCFNSNHCYFSQLCRNSSNLRFCYDMIGCHDCFGSVGLRNVRYYFFNEKCSKEQYEEKLKQYSFASQKNLAALYQQFYRNFVVKLPIRNDVIINSEACSGNYIQESKDVHYSFDVEKTDTGRDSWGVEYSKDVYRCDFVYYAENCYENISNSKSHNIVLSFCALNGCYDLTYCMLAFNNSHDSFGCLSLKHNQYCILNKQYSEKEYKDLVEKLVNHMKKTGEWGQFFPPALSLFAYNETPSQEYFPLSRAEVAHFGAAWKEDDQKEYLPQTYLVPDFVDEVEDDILSAILACSDCSKNYRLIERELDFYRSNQISVPTKCPYCRHLDRLKLRNPKKLWSRYGKYPVF